MNTPVLFLIFNRPEIAARTFAEIARAKPPRVYIAADGPREDRPSDIDLCKKTRSIVENINWDCEVITLFRDANLGCRAAVSSAINWFFERESEGIVIEDDCFPHPSFFQFCEIMLDRYRSDDRILHITGSNFQNSNIRGNGDYYFSRITHVWGWASWRRVWNNYDVDMKLWPLFRKENHLANLFPDKTIAKNLDTAFQLTYTGNINTWDYQLFLSNLIQGGLCIIPNQNLISNIGFNEQGTHTTESHSPVSDIPLVAIEKFDSPSIFLPDSKADSYTLKKTLPGIKDRIMYKIKGIYK